MVAIASQWYHNYNIYVAYVAPYNEGVALCNT